MSALDTAELAGRLRLHARRAKNELGYRTPVGMPRAAFAAFLRRQARLLPRATAQQDIEGMLDELDKVNR